MANEAPFSTIEEAREWFANGQARHGKRAFTATQEYHDHYEAFRALDQADRAARRKNRPKANSTVGGPASLLGHAMRGTKTE